MHSGDSTNYIILEKGTDDVSLLFELDEIVDCVDIPPTKGLVSLYPHLYELRYLLRRMVGARNSNQNEELIAQKGE